MTKTNTITQQEKADGAPLLSIRNLKTYYPVHGGPMRTLQGYVHAVDDISLDVFKGETVGLVGESGCGKSTLAQTVMCIVKHTDGSAVFEGRDLFGLSKKELREMRRYMQIIYQDPYSSLDPRMCVGDIIGESLLVHGIKNVSERKDKVMEIMNVVGLQEDTYSRFPHEFSGGQRQRVSIARSLILNPKLIWCDEPVSALDVSIQSQILNLLRSLQNQFDLTYVFISHALNVVRHVSDKVCVMYLGKVVEIAPSDSLFEKPLHPYTTALISAIPIPDPKVKRSRVILQGDLPSPKEPPNGCRFHTRCPYVMEHCRTEVPALQEIEPGHFVACHLREGGTYPEARSINP